MTVVQNTAAEARAAAVADASSFEATAGTEVASLADAEVASLVGEYTAAAALQAAGCPSDRSYCPVQPWEREPQGNSTAWLA